MVLTQLILLTFIQKIKTFGITVLSFSIFVLNIYLVGLGY